MPSSHVLLRTPSNGPATGTDARAAKPEKLLQTLAARTQPLSDAEVHAVADFLNNADPRETLHDPRGKAFKSKDLKIGTLRSAPFVQDTESCHGGASAAWAHFDEDTQREAFTFVKSDCRIERALEQPRKWISIAGVALRLYSFQLFAAFWMLKGERGPRRGVILADDMGLGKTVTTFLYIYFNYLLAENAQHIRGHPDEHCHPDDPNPRACPSASLWPIVCACEKQGVTCRLGLLPRFGATLLILPKSLLPSWRSQWESFTGSTKGTLRFYVHHRDYPRERVDGIHRYHLALDVKRASQGGGRDSVSVKPRSRAHEVIVATTVGSYWTQVQEHFGRSRAWRSVVGRELRQEDLTDGLAWARVVCDEAHLHPNWGTSMYQILESLARSGWHLFNFVAVTATPVLRNGVSDIIPLILTINMISPDVGKLAACRHFSNRRHLTDLESRWKTFHERARGDDESSDPEHVRERESLAQQLAALRTAYTIQRRHDSVQNGKQLMYLPPLECYDVECASTDSVGMLLAQLEKALKCSLSVDVEESIASQTAHGRGKEQVELSLEQFLANSRKTRILATVPGLASLFDDLKALGFTFISRHGWHVDPRSSVVFHRIRDLVDGSGKLQVLRQIIQSLGHDIDGDEEKLVVVSKFPIVCLVVLSLCTAECVPSEWMHAGLDAVEREDLTARFQNNRDGRRAGSTPVRIMVGSTRILGQGITLNKAIRLVLMEPAASLGEELQVYKRVHRIGTRSDRCYIYRLLNPASNVEKLLVRSQSHQNLHDMLVQWLSDQPARTSVGSGQTGA